ATPHVDEAIGGRVLVDVSGATSEMKPMVHLAGRIAHGDDGIQIPYTVAHREDKAAARQVLADAEPAAEAAGYDCTGVLRLSESSSGGTSELVDETDATLVVLAWHGPRLSTEQFFGSEPAGSGAASPVPTVAAHLTEPWDRVIVVPGTGYVPWQSEDVHLTLDVASRLTARGDTTLLVIADDEAGVQEYFGTRTQYE